MRPWLSGITGPCQGSVGVSITPGRTSTKKSAFGRFFCSCGQSKCLNGTYGGNRKSFCGRLEAKRTNMSKRYTAPVNKFSFRTHSKMRINSHLTRVV